ncbi:uncharacterized protein [Typha latifolia]|uniref:uncharacterized protein isoform X2 n=1 Tax=Typha latifolia TaxID=4733 RepID=UPI003C2EBA18
MPFQILETLKWALLRKETLQQHIIMMQFFLTKILRCLQDNIREKELRILSRNNHFSTMLKFNGELNLLATDQVYLNKPDLVREKLSEVNGNTDFMTGNFEEFKTIDQGNKNLNEDTVEIQSAIEVSESENVRYMATPDVHLSCLE